MTTPTLWLVALTGLLGAPHCIGMCGGTMTSLTLQARGRALATIVAYNCGRILTYTCIGAFMGGAGSFVDGAAQLTGLQGFASLLGGILILLWTYRKLAIPLAEWGPLRLASVQRLVARLRASQSSGAIFATGVLLGFLPCGLTYAMEINAVTSASVWRGGLIMLVFGLATLPALAITGLLAGWIKKSLRTRILLLGQWSATLIGILAIMRGLAANGWIPSIHPWLW
ncbi:sulfite exporter TauE/SafE family protein [Paenibacillus aestuarii]|uniref:Sulfite exporter TauE/SafE family protein n=1 Tax=Paenibacillus aestuarii TaxID=516965 RepID=A0ABW0KEX2_9BACL|nr:sulfite exporter TauE/SafE family protein [Paenibacillus aestuarii]